MRTTLYMRSDSKWYWIGGMLFHFNQSGWSSRMTHTHTHTERGKHRRTHDRTDWERKRWTKPDGSMEKKLNHSHTLIGKTQTLWYPYHHVYRMVCVHSKSKRPGIMCAHTKTNTAGLCRWWNSTSWTSHFVSSLRPRGILISKIVEAATKSHQAIWPFVWVGNGWKSETDRSQTYSERRSI